MRRASASAKINLALVVGPRRDDGKHEVVTVLQRVDLADRIELEPAQKLAVDGYRHDTIVRRALEALAGAAGVAPAWRVTIEKRIPVAAGLGGGSSDAAAALSLANAALPHPLEDLHGIAASVGADVPFFLTSGPQLGTGDGSELETLDLPQDYWVVLVLPRDARKASTADVYAGFDARSGAAGFDERREELLARLADVLRPGQLAALPPNDLASSPLARDLRRLGAFRADVSGAGPAVYGLFGREHDAREAARTMRSHGRIWLTAPAWYG
jgi:4-diphosphocytidyl-2-C-methyl-D-erythritol kinase